MSVVHIMLMCLTSCILYLVMSTLFFFQSLESFRIHNAYTSSSNCIEKLGIGSINCIKKKEVPNSNRLFNCIRKHHIYYVWLIF